MGLPLILEGAPKLVINDLQVKVLTNVGSRNVTGDSVHGDMYLKKIKVGFEFDSIGVNLGQNNIFDPLFSALGQYYVRKVIKKYFFLHFLFYRYFYIGNG